MLFFGWSLFALILVYWLENGIIGLYNLLRMATVEDGSNPVTRAGQMTFFTVHYGIFWVVHGFFVFTLFGGDGGSGAMAGADGALLGKLLGTLLLSSATTALAILSLVVSHGVSFAANWLQGSERARTNLQEVMMQPYSRVVILHFTILGGGFAADFLGSPVWSLVLMVVLKIGVDLAAHSAEHAKLGAPSPAA